MATIMAQSVIYSVVYREVKFLYTVIHLKSLLDVTEWNLGIRNTSYTYLYI